MGGMPDESSIPSTESTAPPPSEPERFEDPSDWLTLVQDPVERAEIEARARRNARLPWLAFAGYLTVLATIGISVDRVINATFGPNSNLLLVWKLTASGVGGMLFGVWSVRRRWNQILRVQWKELHAGGYRVCPKCGYLCGKSASQICPECGQAQ